MRPFFVVVIGPGPDQGARMGHAAEHGLVQKFVAHATVETFHKAVLHRLASRWKRSFGTTRDVVPVDLAICGDPAKPAARPLCVPVSKGRCRATVCAVGSRPWKTSTRWWLRAGRACWHGRANWWSPMDTPPVLARLTPPVAVLDPSRDARTRNFVTLRIKARTCDKPIHMHLGDGWNSRRCRCHIEDSIRAAVAFGCCRAARDKKE